MDDVPPNAEEADAVPPRVLEVHGQAITTAPVLFQLCYKRFGSEKDLAHHCQIIHGNLIECRRHVFWKAEEARLQPFRPWCKRAILNNHALFHRFSILTTNINHYCEGLGKDVPRRMEACAICAMRDWIERRTQIYLFAKPDGKRIRILDAGSKEVTEGYEDEESHKCMEKPPPHKFCFYYTKNKRLTIGQPDKVDKFLGVQHYITAGTNIPFEELHASSVQHPYHSNMRWLLHSRRVPKHAAEASQAAESNEAAATQAAEHGVQPPEHTPRCAGVGKEAETVWICFDCARCLCKENPEMPPLALAIWMKLERSHHLFTDFTLAMRLLLEPTRPVTRSLDLGRAPRDKVHRGLQGNAMIIAQPTATYKQIVPDVNQVCNGVIASGPRRRSKNIACENIFPALPWREELEYHLESDDPTEPYAVTNRSRFDDPGLMTVFADMHRRMISAATPRA